MCMIVKAAHLYDLQHFYCSVLRPGTWRAENAQSAGAAPSPRRCVVPAREIPLFSRSVRRLQRVVIALLWLVSDRAAIVCVPSARSALSLARARRSSFLLFFLRSGVRRSLANARYCWTVPALHTVTCYSDFKNTHAAGVYGYLTFAVAVVPFALSPSLLRQKKFVSQC